MIFPDMPVISYKSCYERAHNKLVYTKNDESKWKLNFQVVQIFLQLITGRVGVRVKGWEELLGAWGLRMYPQMTKNDQKWKNSIDAMLKPNYEAILLHKKHV